MRNKLLIIALSVVLFSTTFTSCDRQNLTKYEARFLNIFNTVSEIVGYAETEDDFMQFAQFIHDNLLEYHQLYDKYRTYEGRPNIKTINDNAGTAPVKVDQRLIDLLLYSKDMHQRTDGKVNIAFGSVLEIWHDYRTAGIDDPFEAELPPMDSLIAANNHTDIDQIIIDEENSTVYLADEHMRLDVGAIAKGYATERVTELALEQGYHDFLLSIGGNTRAAGKRGPGQSAWNVGIKNPDKESEHNNLFVLTIHDLSLVASGNYERYYTVDGKQYHHIIDPETLMPADYFTAVSVVTKDSGLADSISTAIYNMPLEEGQALINSLEETEALWVLPDGTLRYSDNFQSYIKK